MMPSFTKHITFLFLILVLSSTVQIHARESKFFSKIFHLGATISPLQVPAPTPAPAPAPEPASANSETQEPYYGLYGQGSGMFPPAKETVTSFENDLLADEPEDEKYERNNYNNNGYTTNNYDNNGYSSSYTSNGYSSNYNNNGYESERQGMSDTRFVEGGKDYYDVKKENYYPNKYESLKETTRNGGFYGNTENYNELDSTEEFQNKEDQYQEISEEAYVP